MRVKEARLKKSTYCRYHLFKTLENTLYSERKQIIKQLPLIGGRRRDGLKGIQETFGGMEKCHLDCADGFTLEHM